MIDYSNIERTLPHTSEWSACEACTVARTYFTCEHTDGERFRKHGVFYSGGVRHILVERGDGQVRAFPVRTGDESVWGGGFQRDGVEVPSEGLVALRAAGFFA